MSWPIILWNRVPIFGNLITLPTSFSFLLLDLAYQNIGKVHSMENPKVTKRLQAKFYQESDLSEPGPCAVLSGSVVSDSLRLHGLQPARLLCPWDFPGKNSGVGCHFLLQGIFPTPGSNPCLLYLLHWQVDSLLPLLPGSPRGNDSFSSRLPVRKNSNTLDKKLQFSEVSLNFF